MRRLLTLLLILILNAQWIGSAAASIPHFRFPGSAAHQGAGTLAAYQDLTIATAGGLANTGQLLAGRDAAFAVGGTLKYGVRSFINASTPLSSNPWLDL